MKIISVGYKRVFNLGNYETAAIELHAEINEGESVQETISALAVEALAWRKNKEGQTK